PARPRRAGDAHGAREGRQAASRRRQRGADRRESGDGEADAETVARRAQGAGATRHAAGETRGDVRRQQPVDHDRAAEGAGMNPFAGSILGAPRRVAAVTLAAVALALLGAAAPAGALSIVSFDGASETPQGIPLTQAGAHPDVTTTFLFDVRDTSIP